MSRRRSSGSTFIDVAEEFRRLPLVASVIAVAVVIIVFELVAPWLANANQPAAPSGFNYAKAFLPFVQIIGWVFAGAILVFGLLGAITRQIDGWTDRRSLKQQTGLDSVRRLSWQEFERLLGEVYRRQGFRVLRRGGPVADGGVDLELHKDGETLLVQAKHWKSRAVRLPQLRELWGAVAAEHADGGIYITSRSFTGDARRWAADKNLTLLDGPQIAELVGTVQDDHSRPPLVPAAGERRVCAKCGKPMVLRTAARGPQVGQQFWGCSGFPECRHTEPITSMPSKTT